VKTHYLAWLWGLKSLYYYRTDTDVKVERVNEKVEREAVESDDRTIVYGTATCMNCNAVKSLLKANNIEFEYIDLAKIGKTAAEVTGREVRSVPQVVIRGEYIGGLQEVIKHLANLPKEDVAGQDDCLSCQG
jgi:glutaredoxin